MSLLEKVNVGREVVVTVAAGVGSVLGILAACGAFESVDPAQIVYEGYVPSDPGANSIEVKLHNIGGEDTELVEVAGTAGVYSFDPDEALIQQHASRAVEIQCISNCAFPFAQLNLTAEPGISYGELVSDLQASIEVLRLEFSHSQAPLEITFLSEATVSLAVTDDFTDGIDY